MNLNNFEKNIDPQTLKRGYNYFRNGNVISVEEADTGLWEAEVQGTKVYNVSISTDKLDIKGWECDCPFDMGSVCKHIAAVLYAIAEYPEVHNPKPEAVKNDNHRSKNNNKKRIEKILKKVTKEELQSFVSDLIKKDKNLRNSFIAYFADLIDGDPDEKYRMIIRSLFKASTDRYGFIDYRKTRDLFDSLTELSSKADKVFIGGNIPESMVICKTMIEEIPLLLNNADDSDGGLSSVLEDAFGLLSRIAEKAPPLLKDKLFKYCTDEYQKEKYHQYDIDDRFLDLIPELVTTEEQEKIFFELIDKRIEIEKMKEYSDYSVVRLICAKLEYLKMNDLDTEIKKITEQNIIYPEFRRILIDGEIREKNYKKAKDLCMEGIRISEKKVHRGTTREWQQKILEISEKENNVNEVRKWSEVLYFNFEHDIKYFKKLKSTYNKSEWTDVCEKIIEKLQKKNIKGIYYSAGALAEIFKEENNTERLLKLVQNNPDDLRFIDEHAVHLRDKYPEEIISLYVEAIKSLAKITDVKIYYEVVKYMKNLSKVKDSEIKLRQLLNYFKGSYRSRRKMMELLNENFPVNINQT